MKKFIIKLIQEYLLKVPSDIKPGDLIKHKPSGSTFEAQDYRYTYDLQPRLFVTDSNGYLFEVIYIQDYERVSDPGEINASY